MRPSNYLYRRRREGVLRSCEDRLHRSARFVGGAQALHDNAERGSGVYAQNFPVLTVAARWRPKGGQFSEILLSVVRMAIVTLWRARSTAEAAFRSRPPRPVARASSPVRNSISSRAFEARSESFRNGRRRASTAACWADARVCALRQSRSAARRLSPTSRARVSWGPSN